MAIYPPNTTPPQRGLNYVWNFLGSSLKTFAAALQPYLNTGTGSSYKSYVGLFTQETQTSDPVVQEAINTFGYPCNWVRIGVGNYNLQLPQPVDLFKLYIPSFGSFFGNANPYIPISNGSTIVGYWSMNPNASYNVDNIGFSIVDDTFTPIDLFDLFGAPSTLPNGVGIWFEIRIYP